MKRILFAALVLALTVAGQGQPAAATRLDDSLSPQQRIDAKPEWRHEGSGVMSDDDFNAMVARIRGFEFRFNTAPYVGKTVQIYFTLPLQISGLKSPSGMRVDWRTRGLFAAGSTIPGARVLVYQGMIKQPMMSEFFDFEISIDGRHMERGLQFDPQFEIEVAN